MRLCLARKSTVNITNEVEVAESLVRLQGRQHASQYFKPQIVLVAQAIGATLDHADLVVQPLDEAERYLVLRPTVRGNAIPMTIDHLREFLIRLEPLPLEARAMVIRRGIFEKESRW